KVTGAAHVSSTAAAEGNSRTSRCRRRFGHCDLRSAYGIEPDAPAGGREMISARLRSLNPQNSVLGDNEAHEILPQMSFGCARDGGILCGGRRARIFAYDQLHAGF